MLGSIGGILWTIISILFFILLLIGLWISKKHSFKAGFYFFLLLMINEVYSLVSPVFISSYVDGVVSGNNELWFDLTIVELTAWFSVIPKIIELAAFIFLVAGLYHLINNRVFRT